MVVADDLLAQAVEGMRPPELIAFTAAIHHYRVASDGR